MSKKNKKKNKTRKEWNRKIREHHWPLLLVKKNDRGISQVITSSEAFARSYIAESHREKVRRVTSENREMLSVFSTVVGMLCLSPPQRLNTHKKNFPKLACSRWLTWEWILHFDSFVHVECDLHVCLLKEDWLKAWQATRSGRRKKKKKEWVEAKRKIGKKKRRGENYLSWSWSSFFFFFFSYEEKIPRREEFLQLIYQRVLEYM